MAVGPVDMENTLKRSHLNMSQEPISPTSIKDFANGEDSKNQSSSPTPEAKLDSPIRDVKLELVKPEPDSPSSSVEEPPFKKPATSAAKADLNAPRFDSPASAKAGSSGDIAEINKLSQFLKSDFRTAKYADLTLKSSDEKHCKVHKVVVVPQSGFLTKIFEKSPKKAEVSVDCAKAILDAIIQYLYFDTYKIPATFQAEWKFNDGKDNRSVEFTFRLYKAADHLEIEGLKDLAIHSLKKLLGSDIYSGELCALLLQIDKKKQDPPVGIFEAVIASQALKVRSYIDNGLPLNKAFHKASAVVRSEFLSEFIIAVGDILNTRFRTYLRCPKCASVIRNKSEKAGKFICSRNDCSKNQLEGELVPHVEI